MKNNIQKLIDALNGLGRHGAVTSLVAHGKKAIPYLLDAISSEKVRGESAAEVLKKIGPYGISESVKALAKRPCKSGQRRLLAQTVILMGPESVPALMESMNDCVRSTRVGAIFCLSNMGCWTPQVMAMLTQALDDPSRTVKLCAAFGLKRAGLEAVPAVASLQSTLACKCWRVRQGAAYALRAIGAPAVRAMPQLVELLRDNVAIVRRSAASAIVSIGPTEQAIDPLIEAVNDEDAEVRKLAIKALGVSGAPAAKKAIPAILAHFPSDGYETAEVVGSALKSLGLTAERAMPAFFSALQNRGECLRRAAVRAIIAFGPNEQVLDAVAVAVDDPDFEVRKLAIKALGMIGYPATSAIPAILARFQQDGHELAGAVGNALIGFGSASILAIPIMIDHIEHCLASGLLREISPEIIHALGALGPPQEAIPVLLEILRTPNSTTIPVAEDLAYQIDIDDDFDTNHVKSCVFDALQKLGFPAIPMLLEHSIDNRTWWLDFSWLVESLEAAAVKSVPMLVTLLLSNSKLVRDNTFRTLQMIGEPAIPYLIEELGRGSDRCKIASAEVLGILFPNGDNIVSALARLLWNPNRAVWEQAIATLKSCGADAIPTLIAARQSLAGREVATEIFRAIIKVAPDAIVDESTYFTEEDKRVLSWFDAVDLSETDLTYLQVFWCVGHVERNALENRSIAMGYKKLSGQLSRLAPRYKLRSLPTAIGTLCNDLFVRLDSLFDREPFNTKAWSDEEKMMGLRLDGSQKPKVHPRWTRKASKAWYYTDRFLRLRDYLPKIDETSLAES